MNFHFYKGRDFGDEFHLEGLEVCPGCAETGEHFPNCYRINRGSNLSQKLAVAQERKAVRNPKFHKLLERMASTHDKKNEDYATAGNPYSNFEEAAAFAGVTVEQVFDVLIGIKQARLKELTQSGKKPNNESIQDTRLDAAVYAALRASYFEDQDR